MSGINVSELLRAFLHAQFGSGWWGIQDPTKQLELAKAWKARGDKRHTQALAWGYVDEFRAAIAAYRKALLFKPDFAEAHHELGASLLILAAPSGGVFPSDFRSYLAEAETALRQASRLRPDQFDSHYTLGLALMEVAKYSQDKDVERHKREEAIVALKKAHQLKPESPDVLCSLSRAFGSADQNEEAFATLQKVLHQNPDFPEAHMILGRRFRSGRDGVKALHSFQKVLLLDPGRSDAAKEIADIIGNLERHEQESRDPIDWQSRMRVYSEDRVPRHLEALQQYFLFLQTRPDELSATRALAGVLLAAGVMKVAMSLSRMAGDLPPELAHLASDEEV